MPTTDKTMIHYCALHCTNHVQRGASDALYTLAVYRLALNPSEVGGFHRYELWAYWGKRGHEQKGTYKCSGQERPLAETLDRLIGHQEAKGYVIVAGDRVGTNTDYWKGAPELGVPDVISTGRFDIPLEPGRAGWEEAFQKMARELAPEVGRSVIVVEKAMRDAIDADPGIPLWTARTRAQLALQPTPVPGNTGCGTSPSRRAAGQDRPRPMPDYEPGPIGRAMQKARGASSFAEALATPIEGTARDRQRRQDFAELDAAAELDRLRARMAELEAAQEASEPSRRVTRKIILED